VGAAQVIVGYAEALLADLQQVAGGGRWHVGSCLGPTFVRFGQYLKVRARPRLAAGESVIKCPSPLNVLKDKYDHRSY
jgi:hypothetical protein